MNNLTNADALDVMVQIGRQALERGKVDQARTILGGVLTKAPNHTLAWFSLGRAHLLKGSHDHAAMCYSRAASLASSQRGAPANLLPVAKDNMVLCAEKVLPRDWLPELQDPHLAQRWGEALGALAAQLAAPSEPAAAAAAASPAAGAAAATEGAGAGAAGRQLRVAVCGGIGLQALALHGLLKAHAAAAAAAAAAPAAADVAAAVPAPVSVTWVHGDELCRTLGAQMAAATGVPAAEMEVVNGWPAGAAAAAAAPATAAADGASGEGSQGSAGVGAAEAVAGAAAAAAGVPPLDMFVAAGVVGSRLALPEWAAALAQARPRLAPGALLCPSRARLVGALAASEDLRAMNEVQLDWMREDSRGLDYGPVNELLWRPARSMQVSAFRYALLSEPFPLLPDITARELLEAPHTVTGRVRRHDVIVTATRSGRADCVITWTEYELAPGVWVSYAPHELQGRCDPPVLCPHVWQRVQYLSARPALEPGARLALQVTLSGGGSEVRVEYDEDLSAVQGPPSAVATADVSSGLPPGEPLPEGELLPAGEPLGRDSSSSSDDDGGGNEEGGAAAGEAGKQEATGQATGSGSGLILPYHMSMLNDRIRTQSYRAGIEAAVAEAKARHPGAPMLVLDVGSGTGLLSMMAARAGADKAIGCERELALAVAAGAVTAANGLSDAVRSVQVHSKDLRVAPETPDQPPSNAAGQGAQPEAADPAPASSAPTSSTLTNPTPIASSSPSASSAVLLPRRAGLVVHEIFGTDPLSEHILPTMAQVQDSLAAPDALFLPSAFRIVAALARSDMLHARMRAVRPPPPLPALAPVPAAVAEAGGPSGGPAGPGAERVFRQALERLARLLPAAAAAALQPWVPWKAELDVLRVPDMVLLSEPAAVAALDLGSRPLPRAFRAAADAEPCAPTPPAVRFPRCGPTGDVLPDLPYGGPDQGAVGVAEGEAAGPGSANCVVYWFEADCGSGGWISTQPGSSSTYYGHWTSNVQFLDPVLPLVAPAVAAAGGLMVRLAAECVVDRVRMGAEWVQPGDDSSSSEDEAGEGDEGPGQAEP
ncbi:hypothetical protein HYH03_014671 [Edaphochlamys debaryana]|uniref:type I protein arginine methyltransferase n=1 Tax=Edaphochlamys debaryana TaxID=47281 RepID=A0A836BRT1_9CHLO|nr:hypothetical protein HYH03_014671 [Edaphochlamys debaryana]|eukprot:KAG2486746.1 hypothetical protein HYH03_014671 [Edaphochlamys debaryana]